LIEGFNNLSFGLEAIYDALKSYYFKGKFVTAVGKTEWADIKWNEQSIADKKTIINGVDIVFISAENVEACAKAKKSLTEARVNDRLLDCSDAHSFADAKEKDRLGNCLTWIKADPTFAGLLQALCEVDERVFMGEVPPQLSRVRNNSTKFIKSLRIERKPTAIISEIWFDNAIPLNHGLVAIIGNKGKGKSALTDTIGLICNTRQFKEFTFLSVANFRQPKDNKARHFRAILTWESGPPMTKGLEEPVDENQPELVKYIPQNFLEKICTQLGRIEESDFDRELKKVIFSHVEPAQRLAKTSLDELVLYKTTEANARIQILKQELGRINEEVVALEEKTQQEYRRTIENLLAVKVREFEAHEISKPAIVPKPENDPMRQAAISLIDAAIETAKRELEQSEKDIAHLDQEKAQLMQSISVIEKLIARIENLQLQVQTFVSESEADLAAVGLSLGDVLTFAVNPQLLLDKKGAFVQLKTNADEELSPSNTKGLVHRKQSIEGRIEQLQTQLDEPNKKYQAYEAELKEWEKQKETIVGNETTIATVKYEEKRLRDLDNVFSPGFFGH
jgi:uncharacterized small protein (DUF1192 family)